MTTLTSMALHSPPVTSLNGCDDDSLTLRQNRLLLTGDLDEEIRRLEREGDCLRNSRPDSVTWSKQLMPEKKPVDILSDRASVFGFRLTDGLALTRKEEAFLSHQEYPFSSYALQYSSTGNLLEKEIPSVSSSASLPLNGLSGILPLPRPPIAKFQSSYSNEEDAMDLQMKLHDSNLIAEKQREHFHFSLEDLRRKYEADVVTKEITLRSKEMEVAAHKSIVVKLKQQNEFLQEDNRRHEKTIKDLRDLLETHQRDQRLVEMGLGQVRGQVLSQEQKRGCRFYEGTPLTQQGVNCLLKSIEKCIQALDTDVELKNDQIKELMEKLERNKEFVLEKEKELELEFESKCSELMKKQKEALDLEANELNSVKKQLAVREEEAARQKSRLEHEIRLKDASLSDLEARLKLAKEDLTIERSSWLIKNQNFDTIFESSRQELGTLKKENVTRSQELSEMKTNQAEMQMSHLKTKTDLDSALRHVDLLRERETSFMLRQNMLEEELRKKTHLLLDLDKKLEIVNQENEAHLKQLAEMTDKNKNKSSAEQVQSLQIQLNALTEKCRQLTLDLEVTTTNYQSLQEKYSQLHLSQETLSLKAEAATREKEKLNADIAECMAEVTRLTLERAAHLESLESSLFQLSSLRCQKDRLVVQLEEREKNFLSVREEKEKLSLLMESFSKANTMAQKERSRLELRLIEANAQLKEATKHPTAPSLRKQKRNAEVRSGDGACEVDTVVSSSLRAELVDAEEEISSLKEQVDVLQRSLEHRDGASEKELSKLLQRLQLTEHNLRVARKALRKHDEIDGRAFEIASRMQKEVTAKRSEVDILNSKIRQLQDSLDVAVQEKRKLEETNRQLTASVRRTAKQRNQLAEEVQLKHRQLQPELFDEKSSSQRNIDRNVQDIEQLNLRHQLEIKEIGQSPHMINGANLLAVEANSQLEDASTRLKHPMSLKSITQLNHPAHSSSVIRLLDDLSEFSPDDHSVPSFVNSYNNCCDSTSVTVQSASSKQDFSVVNCVQNCHRKANQKWPEDAPTKDYSSVKPSSSVFELLTGNPSSSEHSTHRESGRHRRSQRSKRTAFDSDTKAICRRLEKRIEALTKIGGNLQEENQNTAKAMKDHGKRLMKLKKEFKK